MQAVLQNVWVSMSSIWVLCLLLMGSAILAQRPELSDFKVLPSVFGVVHVTSPQQALNATEARLMCQRLGMSLATKAQVKQAHEKGLETCRYGWIDEQIVVIPRIKVNKNCGQGRTGVLDWRKSVNEKSDAFCFNVTAWADVKKPTVSSTPGPSKTTNTISIVSPTNMNFVNSSSSIHSASSSSPSSPSLPGYLHASAWASSAPPEGSHGDAEGAASSATLSIFPVLAVLLLVAGVFGLWYLRKAQQSEIMNGEELRTTWKQDARGQPAASEMDGNSNDISLPVATDTQTPSL